MPGKNAFVLTVQLRGGKLVQTSPTNPRTMTFSEDKSVEVIERKRRARLSGCSTGEERRTKRTVQKMEDAPQEIDRLRVHSRSEALCFYHLHLRRLNIDLRNWEDVRKRLVQNFCNKPREMVLAKLHSVKRCKRPQNLH